MLPRHRRVPKELFKEIMRSGKSYHTPHLSLRWIKVAAQNVSRFSVVVPKKAEKHAVGRNYAKRVVYTALYPLELRGISGIFFIKKIFSKAEIAEIHTEINELLKRIDN
jgi:ribonuclease P protein component